MFTIIVILRFFFLHTRIFERFVETSILIVGVCVGVLLVIFGFGWACFFCKARKNNPEDESVSAVKEKKLIKNSRLLCEPLMNPVDNDDETISRCESCATIIVSTYDTHCPVSFFLSLSGAMGTDKFKYDNLLCDLFKSATELQQTLHQFHEMDSTRWDSFAA